MRLMLVDRTSGRIIDYVQFNGLDGQRNVNAELAGTDDFGPGGVWDTNRLGNSTSINVPIKGVINQILASQQAPVFNNAGYATPVTSNDWASANVQQEGFSSVTAAANEFRQFINKTDTTHQTMQAPFTPTRQISVYYTWQANDPLVHYTLSDLTGLGPDLSTLPTTNYWKPGAATNTVLNNIGHVNKRYLPWNGQGNPLSAGINSNYLANLTLKDPLVSSSDDWQFPTNRYPNIGWLGRVHRGTPWQTVYMKSTPMDTNTTWQNWSGNANALDAAIAQPTNDWGIFDLFTTAPNDNASRGQLSINQTNFAAWAAVLDGVIVVTNSTNGYTPMVIDPNP